MSWSSVEDDLPKKDGRYFILVDFDQPCILNDSIVRKSISMVSNFRVKEGWMNLLPEMTITHWMTVPLLEE